MRSPPLPVPLGLKCIGWLCIVQCSANILTLAWLLIIMLKLGVESGGIPVVCALQMLFYFAELVFVGIGIMRLRKSSWFLAAGLATLMLALGMFNAMRLRLWEQEWAAITKFAAIVCVWVAVLYYLTRSRIRLLFGIGSPPTKTSSYPHSG
jgi:hypothetical protein